MHPAILIAAAQALAATSLQGEVQQHVGARLAAIATVEILPSATTRDDEQNGQIARHRRRHADGRITLDFE